MFLAKEDMEVDMAWEFQHSASCGGYEMTLACLALAFYHPTFLCDLLS